LPFSNLNKEQHSAATCGLGNNLVIASAGTGKTSTIVARISHLIKNNTKPEDILLLTFTNKAALEMIQRVSKFFPNEAVKIQSGTFHSVSYKLLKQFQKDITLKQPKELNVLFKTVYEKRDFSLLADVEPYSAKHLYESNSLYLNTNTNQSFGEWISRNNEEQLIYKEIYEDIILEFDELKKKFGYVNYDDLLILCKEELKQQKLNFKEVLIDEYQDTNPLQNSLITAIKPNSLFCVGDYDQSIYAFNGSDIGIISNFDKTYDNAKVFTLTKNYRSVKPILDLANKVIVNNERVYPKTLEVVRQENFGNPKVLAYNELFDQYKSIAKKIHESKNSYKDIAVIFRNNSSADGIETALREYSIPSKRKGGISFFDTREIKAILDILTIISNKKDMMAFIHIFEYAPNIGSAISKELFDALMLLGNNNIIKGFLKPEDIKYPFATKTKSVQLGLFDDDIQIGSVSNFRSLNIEQQLLQNPILKHPKLSVNSASFVYKFFKLLKHNRNISKPSSLIEYVNKSELFIYIKDFLAKQRAKQKDGSINEELKQEALENIERKIMLLKDLSKNYKNLERYLNAMILGAGELSEKNDGVNLLSIHASKGLEFKEVYVVDLMDGRFPNRKLMSQRGSLEEERRLFYVAVTRAKDILYLSFSQYDKIKKIDYKPSIFLYEAGLVRNKE
jgi:DNA helicase-2/ATP-dependent DNA helicase PcrA